MNGLGFLDVVDRFSGLAASLKMRASHPSPSKSHYTEVILSTEPIVNTVREADPMEAALFTVVPPSHGEGPSIVDLKRREPASATPLRKAREAPLALLDPDEYLTSALRLGEKYSVMPRAQARAKELQERTQSTKKRIYELEVALKDLQTARSSSSATRSSPPAQKLSVKYEEQKTRDMEARVAAARKKRDGLLKRANTGSILSQGKNSPAPPSIEEAAFWSAPFSNSSSSSQQTESVETSLDDDEGDEGTEGDTSVTDSPSFRVPQHRVQVPPLRWSLTAGRREDDDMETDSATDTTVEASTTPEEPEEEDGDATVVLAKPPPPRRTFSLLRNSIVRSSEVPPSSSPPTSHIAPTAPSQVPPLELSTYTPNSDPPPAPQAPISLELPTDTPKPTSPVEITLALQEHTAQVWRTIGDLLIPNNPYDTGSGEGTPPNAWETISLLTALGSLPVANIDPASHDAVAKLLAEHGAISPIPPPHALQVITAQLVLLLLCAPGPSHTISRSALKDALKANPWAVEAAGDTDWGTKAIYHCVGKKLISIDRKEGMVRFAPNK